MKTIHSFLRWVVVGVGCLVLTYPGAARAAGDLTPAEVRQLSRFDGTLGLRDVPGFARAEMEAKVQRSYREAKAGSLYSIQSAAHCLRPSLQQD